VFGECNIISTDLVKNIISISLNILREMSNSLTKLQNLKLCQISLTKLLLIMAYCQTEVKNISPPHILFSTCGLHSTASYCFVFVSLKMLTMILFNHFNW